ncbi:Xaa-Pro dipeptidase [uncultured archaeon]|nr:Xaa-Pro dipeptidase [uncultured archaeon]
MIEQSEEDILACKPFFPTTEGADIVHAATCRHAEAILISNDSHFKRIKEEGLIDVWSISEAIGEKLGYKDYLGGLPGNKCGFVGHGVGLELDEYPVIGPLDHVIQSNMTVAIEPKMIYPDKGVLGVEDTYLTTPNGDERLTSLPQEIWRV